MNKSLLYLCGLLMVGILLSSCQSNVFFTGSSQSGVFYNQLALRTGGGGGGGFSPYRKKYRQGRQIEPNDVYHTVGISFLPGVKSNFQFGYPTIGFHYNPRFNLAKWGGFRGAFALEFPMHFGVSIGSDFINYPGGPTGPIARQWQKETTNFTAEIPLCFTLNFGHNATKKSYQDFGGFFGLGYSFAYLPSGRTGVYDASIGAPVYNLPIGHGPHARGGFRFRTGTLSWQVYGSFMYNIYTGSHLGGCGIGLTLGSF